MKHLIETEGLPEPNRPQTVWKKSLARKTASVLGVLALSVSAIGPQPASASQEFKQIKSPNPIQGWGNSCTPEGTQMFLVDTFPGTGKAVTVFECKSKGNGKLRWYNNGNLYKDLRYISE